MDSFHNLLKRQLKRYFGETIPQSPELENFLQAVNQAYIQFDIDRKMIERSMELSSRELSEVNTSLKKTITEQKKLQSIVVQNEKMSAVGQLAAGIAHEINNPLGIILGFSQSLRSEIPEHESSKAALNFIEAETLRCKSLVQNLLVFSRASTSEQKELDLGATVTEALSLVLAQSRVKDIELIKNINDSLPKIMANRTQIQQVVINLCNNAMDAMPKGGTLKVEVSPNDQDENNSLRIIVADTGKGISPDIQSKIFEPFFTTKEVGKGTGLGLSLVYEIVQKHNGRIDVQSNPGKGTTFTVYLPVLSSLSEKAA